MKERDNVKQTLINPLKKIQQYLWQKKGGQKEQYMLPANVRSLIRILYSYCTVAANYSQLCLHLGTHKELVSS